MRHPHLILLALAFAACDSQPLPTAGPPAAVPVCPQPSFLAMAAPDCDCGSSEPEPVPKSSGGSLALPRITASRKACASPCTVMFSLEALEDPSVSNTFTDLGTQWDYGDPDADEREGMITRGGDAHRLRNGEAHTVTSREGDTNTPLGMHTYTCETDECVFHPGVAVRNPAGDWATAWTTVTVQGSAVAFEKTTCVSNAGNWEGCPQGSDQLATLPDMGQWQSNTRYLLRGGETHGSTCIPYGIENVMVEAYGEGRPTVAQLNIGRDRHCRDVIPPSSDREVWNNNITVTGIRVAEIGLGMSFKDITLHDLDMDYEQSSGGGRIRTSSTDACTRHTDLLCADIPTPQGLYISDSRIIGSRSNPPHVNLEFLSSTCVSFFGAYNLEVAVAVEHNLRIECASRVLAIHNNANGEHLGSRGRRNAITVRPEGYNTDDMLGAQKRNSADRSFQYGNRDVAIVDNYLGMPNGHANNAARITIAPTKASVAETTYRGLVSRNYTDLSPSAVPTNDVQLSGVDLVCYSDNRWQGPKQCRDSGPGVTPHTAYEPATPSQAAPEAPSAPDTY